MANDKLSAAELHKNIGKKALLLTQKGLQFEVIIKDVEVFYGMPYYMVQPVAGSGLARVRDHLRILEGQPEI